MGSVLSHIDNNSGNEIKRYENMSGEELMFAYGMKNTVRNKSELVEFLEVIHTTRVNQQIELALFGGTTQPEVTPCGSLKEKHE